tara:strand:+ start:180 stop:452 length:273 start_codon:yes stop_codon:yes gene_type:complete
MMVKIVDTKGKERYVNAAYVRSVSPKGDDKADIDFGHWSGAVRVKMPADQVAEIINASLPSSFDEYLAALDQQTQTNNNATAAASIAVIG